MLTTYFRSRVGLAATRLFHKPSLQKVTLGDRSFIWNESLYQSMDATLLSKDEKPDEEPPKGFEKFFKKKQERDAKKDKDGKEEEREETKDEEPKEGKSSALTFRESSRQRR